MKKDLIRSLKYLLKLIVLMAVIFGAMVLTGTSRVSGEQLLSELFFSRRGVLLLAVLLAVVAAYPRFGFVTRSVGISLGENRQKVLDVMALCGYELVGEQDGKLLFRAGTPLRRLVMMGEDPITVTDLGDRIELSGIRKQVVTAEFRLKSIQA